MPNLAVVLKGEIARLARKEARSESEPMRKASTQHRRYIAELRRQVATLQRQVASLQKRPAPAKASDRPSRFTAKGLRSHRARLGLSAGDYGRLINVSAQSIYNWEREAALPREAQKAKLAALRGIGAREAKGRLEKLDG